MDKIEADDEMDAADAVVAKPGFGNPRLELAMAAAKSALTNRICRRVKLRKIAAIVITAPSAQWIAPLTTAVSQLLSDVKIVAYSGGKYDKFDPRNDRTAGLLAGGAAVVGISQSSSNLPPSLVAAADESLIISKPDGALLRAVARRCLRGRPGRSFDDLGVVNLDFDDICACMPRGTSATVAAGKLKQRNTSFAGATSDSKLPPLESAAGYGKALDWALELKSDIADYRAGLIPWSEVSAGSVWHGPPGVGKTVLARMLAEACEMPMISLSIGELFATTPGHLNEVVRAARDAFNRAVQLAPSLLFLDEIDALPDRASLAASRNRDYWTPIITDFLMMLDSNSSKRDGVVVVGATNRLADLDEALLRPERLERQIYIGPPDPPSLARILRHYLADDLKDADLLHLAFARPGSTGAHAKDWVKGARRIARRAGRPMTLADLEAEMIGDDNRSSADLRRIAVHEAGHAVVATALEVDVVDRVTIQASSGSLGHTAFVGRRGELLTKVQLENEVVGLLAGRAAELAHVDGQLSTSAGGDGRSDIARATQLIGAMHVNLGMAGTLIWRGPQTEVTTVLSWDPAIRAGVEADLSRLMEIANALVRRHAGAILQVADALLARKTVGGDEVRQAVARTGSRGALPGGEALLSFA